MREPNSSTEPAPIAGTGILACLGGCLLFGLLVQTLLARNDRGRVEKLEAFSETTAVGDRVYYPVPSPLPNPPIMVARVKGGALVPVSYDKFEYRDTKMQPSARDPASKLTIYEHREPLPDAGGEKCYFVKTAA
ncbi:MAG: hypothetical protein ABIZ56_11850, partial [Chthoniobacteraceae bacterium]